MFADLWKDFFRRFWWAIVGIVVVIIAGIAVINYYQQVTVSGYRVSREAAKAVEYYKNGDLVRAEAQYKSIVASHPRDWFSWNGLANVYRDQSEYTKAEEAYLKALAINPRYDQAYRNIYNLYYAWSTQDKTQFAKSEAILLQGIKFLPKSEIILEEILNYYQKTGNQDQFKYYEDKLNQLRHITPKGNEIVE